MIHQISESSMTSFDTSSSGTPKRNVYYVQSPSRDSHEEDKSSSMQAPSPMDSPSYSSSVPHSRASSASSTRVSNSGPIKWTVSVWRGRKRLDRWWPEGGVIYEEEEDPPMYAKPRWTTRKCQIVLAVLGFAVVFSLFCFVMWGVSRPYKPVVSVKDIRVDDIFFGEGSDHTGVPTRLLTINTSVTLTVYNSAAIFGIHVTFSPFKLMYAQLPIATGQMLHYYLPRKGISSLRVALVGKRVALYGAGASLQTAYDNAGIPVKFAFEVLTQGFVVGKLVKSESRKNVVCSVVMIPDNNTTTKFKQDSCIYE